nr:IgGFc-binding protein-like isoform X2 [Crassostrea virginica]
MNCGDGEVCFTESHLTRNGIVVFNTGCRTLQTCQTKRNNVLNRNGLYRVVPHTHCLECCSTDLCNSKGCGKPGYPLTRGPACFDCQQISKPMLCDQISICDQNEECYLQREYEFDDVYYSSRCINKHTCALNPEVFGKRNTDHCSHCCSTDLCNNKCSNSSLQTNATTTPTILTGQDTPQGSHGKEFLVLFMKNLRQTTGKETAHVLTDSSVYLNITSSSQLQSTIKSMVDRNYDFNSYINISFPNNLTCDYFTKESKAVRLTTSNLSTVVIFDSYDIYTTDGTIIIPTRKLSTAYIISTANGASQFAVGSMHSETNIQIRLNIKNNTTLSLFGRNMLSGDTFSIRLNEFETLQISHPTDLSGTFLSADKPFAVFSGSQCKSYPQTGCSHMVSQLPPIKEYDNEYIIPSFLQNTGTIFQVVSPVENNVTVTTGIARRTLHFQAYDYKNFEVASDLISVVKSDFPVQITGFAMGSHQVGPYMTVFPGIHHYLDYYKILVPAIYRDSFICVIIPDQSLGKLMINDLPVHNYTSAFQKMASSAGKSYSIKVVKVQPGPYILKTTDRVAFGVIVYGHRHSDGYGYAGNFVLP